MSDSNTTPKINSIIEQLIVKHCPIVYFHKDEPYMPSNFADMISISDLYDMKSNKLITKNTKPQDLVSNSLISIHKKKVRTIPVGNEIICRTKGIYKLMNDVDTFIDLLYIVYFAYNGTLEPHVYDQEFIIVRLFTDGDISDLSKWQLIKCFGSIHGGGMWYDNINIVKTEIDGQLRPVFYSAKESHAMYHKPGLYKRIFRFGDDLAGIHKLWNPHKVICMIDSRQDIYTNIYNYQTKQFENDIAQNKFYRFNGLIGNINQSSKQAWAGSNVYIYLTYYYDTVNTLPFPKYEGGISNLFVGQEQQISKTLRYGVFYSCVVIWFIVLFIALYYFYMSYKPLYKFTKLKLVKFIGLSILVLLGIVIYFMVSFYIGLDLFIINDNYYQDQKVRHLIMVDEDN